MLVRSMSLAALVFLLGCSPSAPPAPPASAPPAAVETVPAPPPPTPTAVPATAPVDEAAVAELLGQLTQAVRKFAAEQQRVPESLNELVTRGYLSRLPAAPPGKTFAITKQLQVELR
jgi:hypothetical protein